MRKKRERERVRDSGKVQTKSRNHASCYHGKFKTLPQNVYVASETLCHGYNNLCDHDNPYRVLFILVVLCNYHDVTPKKYLQQTMMLLLVNEKN